MNNEWDGDLRSLTEEATVVSWQDGDLGQIANIAGDAKTYNDRYIITNKHSAAQTAVEQAADLGKCFKSMHANAKQLTCCDVDPKEHPLKQMITKSLLEYENKNILRLLPRKKKALIDLLTCASTLYQKSIWSKGTKLNV